MKTNKRKLESNETTLKKAFRMLSSLVKMAGSKLKMEQRPAGTAAQETP